MLGHTLSILVRDSYFALAAKNRLRGENLLHRWVVSDQALFKRLALHALTENTKSDIQLARKLLVAGRKPGVWELELQREVLRFFRLAGSRLPRGLRVEVVRAIHVGPKFNKGKAAPNYAEIIHHEKALRLHKLSVSGALLDKKSRALAEEVTTDAEDGLDERDEFLSWQDEGGWISDEQFAPRDLLQGSVADVMAAFVNNKIGPHGLRGLVLQKPVKVASALRRLSKRGEWPANCWQEFLWYFAEQRERPERNTRFQEYAARILVAAPMELVGFAAAGFVKRLAEEYGIDKEADLRVLWEKAWKGKTEESATGIRPRRSAH